MTQVLFIGNYFPEPIRDALLSGSRGGLVFSNDIFERNVIRALALAEGVSLKAVTVPGVGSFPKDNCRLFTPQVREVREGIERIGVGSCNLWPFFVFSRRMHLQRVLTRVLRTYAGTHLEILLCAPAYYALQALNTAMRRTRPDARVTVLLPDIPVIMDEMAGSGGLRGRLLRRISMRSMALLQSYRRYILLTEGMRDFVPPDSDVLVMEGIVNDRALADSPYQEASVIAYTGVVDRQFGLDVLLDAFEKLSGAELRICGSGPMAAELGQYAAAHPAVRYYGLVTPEEAAEIRCGARVLVNPRTSAGRYTRYSFPSKTLEYLASGKTVVANMLPGIPEEYREYLVVPEREDAESLAVALERALRLSPEETAARAKRTRAFVLGKTARAQGRKILDFLVK